MTTTPRRIQTCINCAWRLSLAPICSRCAEQMRAEPASPAAAEPAPIEPIPEHQPVKD